MAPLEVKDNMGSDPPQKREPSCPHGPQVLFIIDGFSISICIYMHMYEHSINTVSFGHKLLRESRDASVM